MIKISSLPVFLGLLGGEPTLHPRYFELLNLAVDAISQHKDGRLYITTNGSKDTEFWESHPDADEYEKRVYILWSYHAEYKEKYKKDGKDYKLFLDNIRTMVSKGYKNRINVMLNPNPTTWEETHRFIDELEKIEKLEIHPHFVYSDIDGISTLDKGYNKEFFENFKRFKSYHKYFQYGDKILNDYDIFSNQGKYNKFKGWDCYNNNYEINWNGIVRNLCFIEKENLFLFKNLKEVTARKCPHTYCNCDGLLKCLKVKGE